MSWNSNGRPEPEVIVNFADGFSYSKTKMDEILRQGSLFERPNTKPSTKDTSTNVNKDDVELIVKQLEIPRPKAEKALSAADGNLSKALQTLICGSTQ